MLGFFFIHRQFEKCKKKNLDMAHEFFFFTFHMNSHLDEQVLKN